MHNLCTFLDKTGLTGYITINLHFRPFYNLIHFTTLWEKGTIKMKNFLILSIIRIRLRPCFPY